MTDKRANKADRRRTFLARVNGTPPYAPWFGGHELLGLAAGPGLLVTISHCRYCKDLQVLVGRYHDGTL